MVSASMAQSVNRYGAMEIRQRIWFDSSDASLDSQDLAVLSKVATLMNLRPNGLFEVEGHTDSTGQISFNEKLGVFRAEVVKNQLIKLGVPAKNLIVLGRGETEPFRIKGRYSPEKSRRVEFRQVVQLNVQIKDSKTRGSLNAELKLDFYSPPYGQWEVTATQGKYSWILPYRKSYRLQASTVGYLSQLDTLAPDPKTPNGSIINITVNLRPVVILERINFENIYFHTGRASISDGSEETLQNIYDLMQKNPNTYIEIRGHVDQPNRESLPEEIIEQGKELSKRRAMSIYDEMVRRGIDPSRMTYRGMGSSEMKYPSPQNEEEQKMNRRVEILILDLK